MMETQGYTLKGLLLLLCFSIQLYTSAGTLFLELGEDDVSVTENDRSVRIIVSSQGDLDSEVTVEIVPMSYVEYSSGGYRPAYERSSNIDYATPALDYNATILRHVFVPGTSSLGDLILNIDITDDTSSENEEVFFVVLQIVNASERSDVTIRRNMTTVFIRTDNRDASNTLIGFNMDSLVVDEGDGIVNDSLFVIVQGVAEPTMEVKLAITSEDDFQLFSTDISILSSVARVPVPFQVIDDLIYEGIERIQIVLSQSVRYSHLYRIGSNHTLTVAILDNDVAKVGFEILDDLPLSLMEGQSKMVCVHFYEPEALATYIDLSILETTQTDAPYVSVVGETTFTLFDMSLRHCINIFVNEDEKITSSWTFTLSLEQELFPSYDDLEDLSSSVLLEPRQIQFTIQDNDGIPLIPSNIRAQLINDGKDMLIVWESTTTDLQPVKQFVVEVTIRQSFVRISRRQINNHGNTVQRYITTETKLILENVDLDMEYAIQVCAENSLGRTCREPLTLLGNDLVIEGPQTEAIMPQNKGEPIPSYIYIVIAVALSLLCLILLVLVCTCVCLKLRRIQNYYPNKQEKKIKTIEGSEGRYRSRSSQSTESVSWGSVSDSDFDPEDV